MDFLGAKPFWTILDEFWTILDEFWTILDELWTILDEFWTILDEMTVLVGPSKKVSPSRIAELWTNSGRILDEFWTNSGRILDHYGPFWTKRQSDAR